MSEKKFLYHTIVSILSKRNYLDMRYEVQALAKELLILLKDEKECPEGEGIADALNKFSSYPRIGLLEALLEVNNL